MMPLKHDARLLQDLLNVLGKVCGERGKTEGALETVERILDERKRLLEVLREVEHAEYTKPRGDDSDIFGCVLCDTWHDEGGRHNHEPDCKVGLLLKELA